MVWRARAVSTQLDVAIKLLRRDRATINAILFERETTALRLLDHPGIVRLRQAGVWAGHYYLVLALVSGRSLTQTARGKHLDLIDILRLGSELARALAHAHSWGVIHRDVKPSNIVVDDDLRPTLIDFGISKLQRGSGKRKEAWGTPSFSAPEQFHSPDEVDRRSDIYALGRVLRLLLESQERPAGSQVVATTATTKPAFGGEQTARRDDPTARRDAVTVVDGRPEPSADGRVFPPGDDRERLVPIIAKMTAPIPADRHQYALQAARELEQLARELAHETPAATRVKLDAEGDLLRVTLFDGRSSLGDECAAIERIVDTGARLRIGYDLRGVSRLSAVDAHAITELHRRLGDRLARIAICCNSPRARSGALLIASFDPQLPCRLVRRPEEMSAWLGAEQALARPRDPLDHSLIDSFRHPRFDHTRAAIAELSRRTGPLHARFSIVKRAATLGLCSAVLGLMRLHLVAAFGSLLNGSSHCAHSHFRAFALHYLRAFDELFPLSVQQALGLMELSDEEATAQLEAALSSSRLATSAGLIDRTHAIKLGHATPRGLTGRAIKIVCETMDLFNHSCIGEQWPLNEDMDDPLSSSERLKHELATRCLAHRD